MAKAATNPHTNVLAMLEDGIVDTPFPIGRRPKELEGVRSFGDRGRRSKVDIQSNSQLSVSQVGDAHGAGVSTAPDPVELEQAAGQGSAERAGEVGAAFGPVKARPGQRSPSRGQSVDIDSELTQALATTGREGVAVAMGSDQSLVLERVGEGHAQLTGQMVIAGACASDRFAAIGFA